MGIQLIYLYYLDLSLTLSNGPAPRNRRFESDWTLYTRSSQINEIRLVTSTLSRPMIFYQKSIEIIFENLPVLCNGIRSIIGD